MAMLIRSRARVPLERCVTLAPGLAPSGAGGVHNPNDVTDTKPVVIIQVGAHRLLCTKKEFDEMVKSIQDMQNNPFNWDFGAR